MKKIQILFLVLFISACGTYNQVLQVNENAFLLIIGSTDNITIQIDKDPLMNLMTDTTSYDLNGKTATKIQISVGNHTLNLFKKGVLVMNRIFYVSNGNSFEVEL